MGVFGEAETGATERAGEKAETHFGPLAVFMGRDRGLE
jgi:hypothetical protein